MDPGAFMDPHDDIHILTYTRTFLAIPLVSSTFFLGATSVRYIWKWALHRIAHTQADKQQHSIFHHPPSQARLTLLVAFYPAPLHAPTLLHTFGLFDGILK